MRDFMISTCLTTGLSLAVFAAPATADPIADTYYWAHEAFAVAAYKPRDDDQREARVNTAIARLYAAEDAILRASDATSSDEVKAIRAKGKSAFVAHEAAKNKRPVSVLWLAVWAGITSEGLMRTIPGAR